MSSGLLEFHDRESFEVTEVGSEVLLCDVLGPGGFSPFGAHVSGRPCFDDGGGSSSEEKFELEFGQLDVVHVDLHSGVLGWAVNDNVVLVDDINDGEDGFLAWYVSDSTDFDVFGEGHFEKFVAIFIT